MVLCTFCSLSACKECSKKVRPYPQSLKDENKRHMVKGTICKLCDRKFYVKKMITASLTMIEANKTSIESFKKTIDSAKKNMKEERIEIDAK